MRELRLSAIGTTNEMTFSPMFKCAISVKCILKLAFFYFTFTFKTQEAGDVRFKRRIKFVFEM